MDEEEEEQVFIGKQKDDLDGVTIPTPYIQQYFYAFTKIQMTLVWACESALSRTAVISEIQV